MSVKPVPPYLWLHFWFSQQMSKHFLSFFRPGERKPPSLGRLLTLEHVTGRLASSLGQIPLASLDVNLPHAEPGSLMNGAAAAG